MYTVQLWWVVTQIDKHIFTQMYGCWVGTQIYKHIFTAMYTVHCTAVVSGYPNRQAYFYGNLYCTLYSGGEWWPKKTSIFLRQSILYTLQRWWVVTQIYKHIFTSMYTVQCTAVVSGDPNIQAYFYANVYCTVYSGGERWPKYTSIVLRHSILYTVQQWWVVTQIYKLIFTPMYIVQCTAVVSGDPNGSGPNHSVVAHN